MVVKVHVGGNFWNGNNRQLEQKMSVLPILFIECQREGHRGTSFQGVGGGGVFSQPKHVESTYM